jgi:hypothetical protein
MSIDWQNGAPDRGRTALPESYKPRALRLATASPAAAAAAPVPASPNPVAAHVPTEPQVSPAPFSQHPAAEHSSSEHLSSEHLASEHLASEEPTSPVIDLRKLEAELGRKRLDEIADVVRLLTYGEMMELAESMWNVRPGDTELTEHNLPTVLYRWSTSRKS